MSAGNDFTHVTFSVLEQGEADFQRTYGELASELAQLQSQLATHLAEWTGSAQQAFSEAHQTWVAAMSNMQDTIQTISSTIGAANANYQDTEQSILSSWG